MKKLNLEIRQMAIKSNIKLWQIANELGISEFTFSRRLRKEVDSGAKQQITQIIQKLSDENGKEDQEKMEKAIDNQEFIEKILPIYGTEKNPMFFGKDVANWLDYNPSNIGKMLTCVSENQKEKKPVLTKQGIQSGWFVSLDGLVSLVLQSRKMNASQIKKDLKMILQHYNNLNQQKEGANE